MGVWGAGLYSNDFAEEHQASIKAVTRLPFEPARLLEILRESCESIANDPRDEDHTTFWLIVADQFHKRGIDLPTLYDKAVKIIDEQHDLEMLASLGMSESDLRKRERKLAKLREQITAPVPEKKRPVLAKPQPYVMDQGDLLSYPMSKDGYPINPYMAAGEGGSGDKWGAVLIVECGRAFGYFAWYRPLILASPSSGSKQLQPSALQGKNRKWCLGSPGTCSPTHFKRLQLQKLTNLPVSDTRFAETFLDLEKGSEYAVADRSIANSLDVDEASAGRPTITGLGLILAH
jgi:hypothetical protein